MAATSYYPRSTAESLPEADVGSAALDEYVVVVIKRSPYAYRETVARVIDAIESRGLKVFARVDHSAGAREAGLELADEEVVLFGNPRVGTPLMRRDPRVGVDLPLKILIWADESGVSLGYRDPSELGDAYNIAAEQAIIEQMAMLLTGLTAEAASQF